jgi:mono/diheme cytochrome c family protein
MRRPIFFLLAVALTAGTSVLAQMPTYRLGRSPSAEEIRALDTSVGPEGNELPPGKGTAKEGTAIFAQKCRVCHGQNGEGSKLAPRLVGGKLHPFATTIWDVINGSMPRRATAPGIREGTLGADEVYALTAFLLFKNGVIQEGTVMDAKTLPRVRMPSRDAHLDKLAPHADETKN